MIAHVEGREIVAEKNVSCSPSAAIVFAHRYFDERHNIVSIGIPLRKLGIPTSIHVYRNVIVHFEVVPDRSDARSPRKKAMRFSWKPTHGGAFPELAGTITSSVRHTVAALHFRGRYRPPFGPLGAFLDRATRGYIARIAVASLLADIGRFIDRHTTAERDAADFSAYEAHLRETHGTSTEPIGLHGSVIVRRDGTYVACAINLDGYAPAFKSLEAGDYALPEDRVRTLLTKLAAV